MPETKKGKKSFLEIAYIFIFGILIAAVLWVIISVWFFGGKPNSSRSWFFENYYNQTQDSRYEWTQQK